MNGQEFLTIIGYFIAAVWTVYLIIQIIKRRTKNENDNYR